MKITKNVNSATNSCGIPAKPSVDKVEEIKNSEQCVSAATYDDSEHKVNEEYIAQLIENVDKKLPDTFITYKYDLGSNTIACTSASPKQIAEYDVPVDDLSGQIDEDTEYILGAIEDNEVNFGQDLVEDGRYEFIDSKTVLDSDGTITDYVMYHDSVEDRYVFVFGDMEIYTPYDENFDWECETEREAWEWFESYEGPGSEDEDEYSDEYSDWY